MRKAIITVLVTLAFMAALLLSTTYERAAVEIPLDAGPVTGRIDRAVGFVKVDWVRLPSESSEADSGGAPKSPQHESSAGGGQVTIVEYEDFQCPYCAEAEPTLDMVRDKYGDQVAIERRDYPLPFHGSAMDAAVAARCADAQGQLDAFRKELYSNQADLSRTSLEEMAHKVGVNERAFSSCLESGRYDAAIQADIAEGKRARVEGTPAFLVNGKLYSGVLSFEQFQSIIDADLASSSAR